MGSSSNSPFDQWHGSGVPEGLRPEIISIAVVTIILAGFLIYYAVAMRKLNPKEPPKGMAFFIFNIINSFKCLVFDTIGPAFVKFTPYILTLFLYITGCNLISLIGLENPTASTTVTFSMGFVTVMGMLIAAIRYQKSRFFLRFLFKFKITSKKTGKEYLIPYCINPFGLLDIVTPLVSISLRLWGNIFAGGLILALVYSLGMVIVGKDPTPGAELTQGPELLIMSIFAVPIHGFLDILIGVIQAYVFVVLTLSYWGNEASNEEMADPKLIKRDLDNQAMGIEAWEKQHIEVKLKNVSQIVE